MKFMACLLENGKLESKMKMIASTYLVMRMKYMGCTYFLYQGMRI